MTTSGTTIFNLDFRDGGNVGHRATNICHPTMETKRSFRALQKRNRCANTLGMSKIEAIVYRATNSVNGHTYIGFTTQGLKHREKHHRYVAKLGKGHLLQAALRKYGDDAIVFEVMAEFEDRDLALIYEQEAIAKYRPEYNISLGGEGRTGPMTEAHKQALSLANKGQGLGRKGSPLTEARKQRLREANLGNKHMLGRKHTDEAKAKISAAHKGRPSPFKGVPRTEETKAKMSAALKGRPSIWKGSKRDYGPKVSAALKGKPWVRTQARIDALSASILKARAAHQQPIMCVNDGKVFSSTVEAAAYYGVKASLVAQCARRGQTMRSGLKFVQVPKSQ